MVEESNFPTKIDFAREWHSHLLRDDGEARDRIYCKVLDCIYHHEVGCEDSSQLIREEVVMAHDKLEATVRSRTLEGSDKGDPSIILYFDETHSLTRGWD